MEPDILGATSTNFTAAAAGKKIKIKMIVIKSKTQKPHRRFWDVFFLLTQV